MLAAARAGPRDLARHAQELIDLATGDRDVELRAALFSLTDLSRGDSQRPRARRARPDGSSRRSGDARRPLEAPPPPQEFAAGRAASFPES